MTDQVDFYQDQIATLKKRLSITEVQLKASRTICQELNNELKTLIKKMREDNSTVTLEQLENLTIEKKIENNTEPEELEESNSMSVINE